LSPPLSQVNEAGPERGPTADQQRRRTIDNRSRSGEPTEAKGYFRSLACSGEPTDAECSQQSAEPGTRVVGVFDVENGLGDVKRTEGVHHHRKLVGFLGAN
jgi:hypothetical protein